MYFLFNFHVKILNNLILLQMSWPNVCFLKIHQSLCITFAMFASIFQHILSQLDALIGRMSNQLMSLAWCEAGLEAVQMADGQIVRTVWMALLCGLFKPVHGRDLQKKTKSEVESMPGLLQIEYEDETCYTTVCQLEFVHGPFGKKSELFY